MSKRKKKRTGRRKPAGERKPVGERSKSRFLVAKKRVGKDLENAPVAHRAALQERIDNLQDNAFPRGAKKVKDRKSPEGLPYYRIRSGDWRAVYTVDDEEVTVYIVGHRSSVYDNLPEERDLP